MPCTVNSEQCAVQKVQLTVLSARAKCVVKSLQFSVQSSECAVQHTYFRVGNGEYAAECAEQCVQ